MSTIRGFLTCMSLTLILVAGPALRAQHKDHMAPTPRPASQASMGSGGSQEMHEVMMRSNDEMSRMKMTGDPDHDFAMMMVPHHQTAIDMAKVEVRSGSDPTIKAMARRIITAQEREIRQFKSWLAKHEATRR